MAGQPTTTERTQALYTGPTYSGSLYANNGSPHSTGVLPPLPDSQPTQNSPTRLDPPARLDDGAPQARRAPGQVAPRSEMAGQRPVGRPMMSGAVSPALLDTETMRAHERMEARTRRARVTAGILEWVGSLAAVMLLVNAVLTVGGANPDNGVTQVTGAVAPYLAAPFMNLFQPHDPSLALALNYGSAAAFWVIAAAMIGRLIRKIFVA